MKSRSSTKSGSECCGPCQSKGRNLSPAMCTSSMCLIASEESRIGKYTCLGMGEKRDFVDSERPQSPQQMEPILETLNDGVVIADDSGQILFVNTVFEEMAGIPGSEIIGRDARQLYDWAEEFALAPAFYHKALEMGRSRDEFFLPTKDGGRLPVVVSVRAMHGPEGGRFAIVTVT